jgi:hypothetical protein
MRAVAGVCGHVKNTSIKTANNQSSFVNNTIKPKTKEALEIANILVNNLL